jgi:transcriptional regulator GlxA family with amidase domain
MNCYKSIIICFLTLGLFVIGYSQTNNPSKIKSPAIPINVAILIYDDVELLDFTGPLEVFSLASNDTSKLCNVYTVGLNKDLITSQKVLQVKPQYTFEDCPDPDIIVLPGGDTRRIKKNKKVIKWLHENIENVTIALSVCTGVSILGEAGYLENQTATTHKYSLYRMKEKYPNTTFLPNKRFIDNGKIVTTAGISAGIDGSIYVVKKLFGEEVANAIVDWMEYDNWQPDNGMIIRSRK